MGGFHALGLPCKGRTYKDALPEIRKVCMEDTKKYMARGGSMDLSSMASMGAYASTGAAPPTQSVAAVPTMTATAPAPQTFPAASPPAQSVVAQPIAVMPPSAGQRHKETTCCAACSLM